MQRIVTVTVRRTVFDQQVADAGPQEQAPRLAPADLLHLLEDEREGEEGEAGGDDAADQRRPRTERRDQRRPTSWSRVNAWRPSPSCSMLTAGGWSWPTPRVREGLVTPGRRGYS